jgi:hypothetical protein
LFNDWGLLVSTWGFLEATDGTLPIEGNCCWSNSMKSFSSRDEIEGDIVDSQSKEELKVVIAVKI